MKVGLAYDERFLNHVEPQGHPERRARLTACVDELQKQQLWNKFIHLPCPRIERVLLERIHTPQYIDTLLGHEGEATYFDADTYASAGTIDAALRAAGGVAELAQQIIAGDLTRGLALVRPPGHHAGRGNASGFCLIGNVAVAAEVAKQHGLRPAIIDFDVHHGNGTQEIFYDDGAVLFISLHRYGGGYYPGTGAASERGRGAGEGLNLNIPLPAASDNDAYRRAFRDQVEPALVAFRPDILICSAGFDAHWRDPLGGMRVDDEGFAEMSRAVGEWANRFCQGRWLAVLEGGYDLSALSMGVVNLTRALIDTNPLRATTRTDRD